MIPNTFEWLELDDKFTTNKINTVYQKTDWNSAKVIKREGDITKQNPDIGTELVFALNHPVTFER
jgi:hypothetical protein